VALYRLGKVSGSTKQEWARALPGDDLIMSPSLVANHADTLDAPPEQVWPWMTQVGWHRAGWYTPHWVDRLQFPDKQSGTAWPWRLAGQATGTRQGGRSRRACGGCR
jgi:hypothetical protein